jgi:hypothetical protein
MPQLYGEVGYGNLSLKLGRFYTIIGYEGVMAPGHFFYSHPYTHLYGEPFTHTGGLANWTPSNNWSFYAGIVDGWDKFDPVTSRAHFLGGVEYTPDHEAYSIAFALITGVELRSDEEGLLLQREAIDQYQTPVWVPNDVVRVGIGCRGYLSP